MIRYDITQGSDEWHQLRVAKVGGSTSHQLHVKSDTLLEQLLAELAEPWQPSEDYVSEAMIRGRELEPIAVEQVGAYVGKSFSSCGWIQSDECELIGASPDGISEDETEIVETKCPSAKVHISYIRAGVVPSDYVDQCVHYFAIHPKLQKVHFASFRPECIKPLFVVTITRESEINVGTKARPVIKTVAEYASEKIELSRALQERLTSEYETLTF
jgi:predicted phage-related endonuclease